MDADFWEGLTGGRRVNGGGVAEKELFYRRSRGNAGIAKGFNRGWEWMERMVNRKQKASKGAQHQTVRTNFYRRSKGTKRDCREGTRQERGPEFFYHGWEWM